MKQYNDYREINKGWIGQIPAHWSINKFNRLSYMKGRIGWQNLRADEFTQEGPYLITGMNFKNGVIRWAEVYHITEERYEEAPEIQLQEGDVLMTKDGTIGKLLFVDYLPGKASLNSHLLVFRPLFPDAYHPRYLYHQLDSPVFKQHIELTKTGTTFYGITQEAVGEYQMILPPIAEQRIIAQFLDDKTTQIDQLITKKQQMLVLLQEERAALINHAVTKGIDAAAPMRDSGIEWLGHIPAHWEVKRLKHLTSKIGSGVTPKGGAEVYKQSGVPILRSQNIHFDGLRLDDVAFIEELVHQSMSNSQVLPGDVLLNITGASIGRCYFADETLGEANVNQHVCIVRPNETITTQFLWAALSAELGQEQIEISQNGSGREGLNFENLKKFVIALPPTKEQREIMNFVTREGVRMTELTSTINQEIDLLKEYRAALIAEAVTGQIDVRNYEPIDIFTAELVG